MKKIDFSEMRIADKKNEKGITLVALVITIVVLLILAGVSLNLVIGNQGILAKAKEAKKSTEETAIKEKIDMALMNYQIEKITNDNLSFKEYMENEEKSGLEKFELIDENPSEDVQFIGKIDGKILIMKTDGSYKLTKGENLVKNGFGENGNENFPQFENNDKTFFSQGDGYKIITSSDYIEIDTSKKYYQAIIGKQNDSLGYNYIGFMEFDRDKKAITDDNVMYVQNSLTYLARDLKDGDNEIYLNNLNGFIKKDIPYQKCGFIFWNYEDSTGYEYPAETYSQNVYKNLFDDSSFDLENNKIKLNKTWNKGTVVAGTKVSQCNKGANYNYGLILGKRLTKNYKFYENTIEGINYTGYEQDNSFRPGTKYIKIMFLINYGKSENVRVDIKDIIFAECE